MNSTLLPGHGLVRRKGMVFHTGTYLGWNQVAHISPQGLRVDSVEVFADGQQITITGQPVSVSLLHQRLQKALSLQKPYDPFFLNCEHLASFLQKGIWESPQVQGAVMGLAVAVSAIASRKMNPAASLVTALVCTLAGVHLMRPGATAQVRAAH